MDNFNNCNFNKQKINALPDDGTTVTLKHAWSCFNVNFNIVFLRQLTNATVGE